MLGRRHLRLGEALSRGLQRHAPSLCGRASSTQAAALAKSSAHYDLVIVGSGPAAQKCAIESAKYGKSVCIVDKSSQLGGVCVHTGTIPSKTFREAVLHLTGWRHQGFYGRSSQRARAAVAIPDVLARVEAKETEVVRDQLQREGIELISGTARFLPGSEGEPHRVMVLRTSEKTEAKTSVYRHIEASLPSVTLSADRFLVACGTRPLRRPDVPFDGSRVFDSDQLLWGGVDRVPRDLIVVGAGVIGMEYASMINVIPGTTVTVIDPRDEVLGFADREVTQALCYSMRKNGARFLLGEKVKSVEKMADGTVVVAHLLSGKRVKGDALLYAMGRLGNTDSLNLEAIGVDPDERGLLNVDDSYQTAQAGVYACGDVIGYPALASTSMEQGVRAAHHMWSDHGALATDAAAKAAAAEGAIEDSTGSVGDSSDSDGDSDSDSDVEEAGIEDGEERGALESAATVAAASQPSQQDPVAAAGTTTLNEATSSTGPYGSIPMGLLDRSSELLFPYGIYTIPEISMVGKTEAQLTRAHLAKGQMLGGVDGFLKLLFDTNTLKLLGVHAFGEGATEIIHIGQVVMAQGGSVDYFRTAVFNYPTLAEAYNVAARDGLRKVGII
ncbi:conserved unknown protein [Ectocarpus siliculosus]|uniref:NAD(P)(+) transhydrogenase (Si-specific) n=1 Tax=Ectocarpus siliculosus TaxID=2880 RepID=D7FKJ5_ECTSI|nr:conserved unknown protein [Ectocarpus siliculosus]|eukprot:CBJ29397.1 conserved unknown protein [Ectocarpus siliculosus]